MAFFLWRSLPQSERRATVQGQLLRGIWRFAAGVTGTGVLATILTQLDKVILSRMLSLEIFGYYTLASVVSVSICRIFGPVLSATYPRLTNLYSLGAWEELSRLYHKSAQLVSVLTLPAAVVIVLFSSEALLLWTQDPAIAERTHTLVSILVTGTALNGLMNIPYALQLASGWTRLALLLNLAAVLLLVPFIIALTKWYGPAGAASVWVILNLGYLGFGIQIMHRRLLPTEKWRWYLGDVGRPLAVALMVAGVFRLILPMPVGNLALAVDLAVIATITLAATALTTPVTRCCAWAQISKWRASHAGAY
jgi:O-antigen/teichoic acid export membrane protein